MQNLPLVSIITPTYNSAETLEETLRSIFFQTYPNMELIIIDGESTDNTKTIIESYREKISIYISEKDLGIYHALNKGISLAKGEIIGILHSDDFYTSETVIESVVHTLVSNHADGVYANLFYVDRKNTNIIKRKWRSGNYKPGAFLNGWMPPHPAFFVKKSVYNQYGNFNTKDFKTAADYELMLRFIHKYNIKISYLDKFIVKMRVGGVSNQSISNRLNANLEDRKAWQINGLSPRFYTLYFKPLRKILQFI